VDRTQLSWRLVDVEQLIELDHPARAVWELAGRLDLSRFCASIQAVEGVSGRTPWDPRLLVSLWVYAYSRGIGSAREIERRCLYEPAFQWLCGLESINHHTLSDFRVDHDAALRELFVQVLGVLGAGGLITLERVMHDGTKIRALAAKSSFCRAEQLEQHLVAAHQQVEALGDPRGEQSAGQKAARHRVVQERQQRLERALGEFKQLQESKKPAATLRVSTSEPEARIMKQADGGFAPSYNLQLSTDAAHKMIVGVALTQSGNDWGQLLPAMERIENNCGAKPKQVVADSGFTTRANIVAMATQEIDFVGSLRALGPNNGGGMERRGIQPEYYKQCFEYDPHADIYRCSIGTVLRHVSRKRKGEALEHTYRADVRACQACPFQVACCGSQTGRPRSVTRVQEPAAMVAFCRKMQADEGKQVYRQRSEVAEFPNAWIKEKLGLRKFRLRGLAKVGLEALWACLTYNIQQWIRLTWRQTLASSAG
jgi:transposase